MPTRLGRGVAVIAAAGTVTPAYGSIDGSTSPAAGSLLLAAVVIQNNSSVTNTCSTPAGWTLRTSIGPISNGTARGYVLLFDKVATGGDAAPSFTTTGSSTATAIVEEYSGLDTAGTLVDLVFTPAGYTTGGSAAVSAGSVSPNTWTFSVFGGRGNTTTALTWGGGQSADTSDLTTSARDWTSTQTSSAGGSQQPSASGITNVTAGGILAVAYRQSGFPIASDSEAMSESSTVDATVTASDSSTLSEASNVDAGATPISGSDSGALAEAVDVAVTVTASDSGTVTDTGSLDTSPDESLSGTDTATLSEASEVWVVRTPVYSTGRRLRAHLYNRTNQFVMDLPLAKALRYQYNGSTDGKGSFAYPLTEWAAIPEFPVGDDGEPDYDGFWVKFSKWGKLIGAIELYEGKVNRAVNGREWIEFSDQPDQNAYLRHSGVYPEYGMRRTSGGTRTFGYMSDGLPLSLWDSPGGNLAFLADDGHRKGQPFGSGFSRTNPDWISRIGVYDPVPRSTNNFFRFEIDFVHTHDVKFTFTADDYPTLFVDGEQVFDEQGNSPHGWILKREATVRMPPGHHVIAARAHTAHVLGPPPDLNPCAFILTAEDVDDDGVVGALLFKTDLSWLVYSHTWEPQWPKGGILVKLLDEAHAYGQLPLIWTRATITTDSNGDAYIAHSEFSCSVGDTVLQVASTLGQSGMDWAVDPDTFELVIGNKLGTDRRATVELKRGKDGGTLKDHTVTRTAPRANIVHARLEDGTYLTVRDETSIAKYGELPAFVDYGSTSGDVTAQDFAQSQLDELAAPLFAGTSKPSTVDGPQLWRDYDPFDLITVPGMWPSTTLGVRVTSGTGDDSDENTASWPEWVEDRSA